MEKFFFCALILAAGKGTRMKSDLAKVLHVLEGKPLLHYCLQSAHQAGAAKIVVIVGHQADKVRQEFAESGCIFVDAKTSSWAQVMLSCRQKMYLPVIRVKQLFCAVMCPC